MIVFLVILDCVLALSLFIGFLYIEGLKDELDYEKSQNKALTEKLTHLESVLCKCDDCHGKGLTIVGHEVTEFGVIWKQGDTDCEVCNGKGVL